MITIIDYGMGNLRSVRNAFEHLGSTVEIIHSPDALRHAHKVVLPGVGAFRDAIANLHRQDLVEPLVDYVQSGRPFLGICLGLQLLFDVSYEDGEHRGLGLIPGKVVRFDFTGLPAAAGLKIPHMGWNQLAWEDGCPLLTGLHSGQHFYFVHSYHVVPNDPAVACGRCHYGHEFTAMIWQHNVFATQFHPEKSQDAGLRILWNFAAM